MIELTGKHVFHKVFGNGYVSSQDGNYVEVTFEKTGDTKLFNVFSVGEYLKFTDDKLHDSIISLKEKGQEEKERKEKVINETKKKTSTEKKSRKQPEIDEQQCTESSLEKLNSMIGLEETKETIKEIINYYEMKKLAYKYGINLKNIGMNFIFTGNPGTAKTTVARLLGNILTEKGILETGEYYEVGRAELVAKYQGQTAPLVKSFFNKAKGGILFMDEIYSLVDSEDGGFGDEALSQIILEMENMNGEIAVIFAGYPDKMKKFIDRNPGLKSRINFTVSFPDYSSESLCEIASYIADEKGLKIDEAAMATLSEIFRSALQIPNFGNGRFARNLIEKAELKMAGRIVNIKGKSGLSQDSFMLTTEDFIKAYAENSSLH